MSCARDNQNPAVHGGSIKFCRALCNCETFGIERTARCCLLSRHPGSHQFDTPVALADLRICLQRIRHKKGKRR